MDVNPNDPQNDSVVHVLLGLLIAIGTFVVNLYRRKVDAMEKSHGKFITREELDNKFEEMRDERQRMHEENVTNIRELRSTIVAGQTATGNDIRSLHQRIDETMRSNSGFKR